MSAQAGRGSGVVAGADGGGTRLRLLLMDAAGQVVGRRMGPAAALAREGAPEVARLLASELRALARETDMRLPLEGFCAGLAGAGRREWAREAEAHLREEGVARRVTVVSDAEAALDDAFPIGGPVAAGILLVAGTGSIALARGADGDVHRVGGWGPLLGDEGSGYWLGLQGLRVAVRALEGRGPGSALASILPAAVGADDPEGVFRWVTMAEKGEVAALAPRVIAAADPVARGLAADPVAQGLVGEAVDALEAHITGFLELVDPPPATVALHGGLVAPGGPLRSRLEEVVKELGLHLRPDEVDAARGAARRARALLRGAQG